MQINAWNVLCVMTILLIACNEASKTDGDDLGKAAQLQSSFTKPIVTIVSPDSATIHTFGIKNCRVYKAVSQQNESVDWKVLFEPAFYPAPKRCVVERLELKGEYLQIEIGTQAIGAGGCCTTYAAYRTRDGEIWEIRPATSIKEWQTLKTDNE